MEDNALEVVSYPGHLFVSEVVDGLDLKIPLLIKDHLHHVKHWTVSDCEFLFSSSVESIVFNVNGANFETSQNVSTNDSIPGTSFGKSYRLKSNFEFVDGQYQLKPEQLSPVLNSLFPLSLFLLSSSDIPSLSIGSQATHLHSDSTLL
jgi:hypothetical protein